MFKVKFADIGEGLTEGTVFKVNFKVGDKVAEGDELFTVETDKVTAEIPAPVDGIIAAMNIKEGQVIKVGEVVVEINDGKDGPKEDKPAEKTAKVEEGASVVGAVPISNDLIKPRTLEKSETQTTSKDFRSTPLARKIASSNGVDLSKISGTGPYNRILVEDVLKAQSGSTVSKTEPQTAAPLAQSSFQATPPVFTGVASEEVIRKPLTGMRKAIAKAMMNSHTNIPAVTLTKTVDISKIVEMRNDLKNSKIGDTFKVTYLPIVVKAVTTVLQQLENINVSLDGDDLLIKKFYNIGIAVDTSRGLVVPVVKAADLKTIWQISNEIRELANKAKNNSLTGNDMKGATFTVSNFGSAGVEFATPIINYPEAAILGVGTIVEQLGMNANKELVTKNMLPLSLTVDHRIIDGADGGRFLTQMAELLENPLALFIN
ncbi:dihydrolipoamide acetyltransferase family protein [Spiroplasma alleghenense]|uniref:Dihydrolipoamide acetyltransferase component of pyruvate dehydrogenase complex n=1 Tax=Spiroplasma alleghenense TaxID=216931 RepID=A0A345Z498_9MOLU|nr:dihydrolipoamide acetyltransferase family protein [Spiroplasma alleghenense]AXK51427.1 pyruvate dehydrogenase E2 component (dihydrolipoamide acetyltransferase) [Spiroplasma alleghenense]